MTNVAFREATRQDLEAIIGLLADDELGRTREVVSDPPDQAYLDGFAALGADPNQLLAVAQRDGAVIGVLQITFIPGISHRGAWRGQIEGVRIAQSLRGQGLGAKFIEWAVTQCAERGCAIVQLTSNKSRAEAHRFYGQLGFENSHEGFKLTLR
ncbi:MAG: GNAT family N-acetyltransferase [Neomegalonema sp.]|nr:GNAT family N-acetyltransferase [Neomegalonema sp.]